jgi:hypothetical protein
MPVEAVQRSLLKIMDIPGPTAKEGGALEI